MAYVPPTFQTLDLGRILQTAQAIRGAQAQQQTDALRQKYLATQTAGAQQQQAAAAQQQQAQMTARDALRTYHTADMALGTDDPKAAVINAAPDFVQHFNQLYPKTPWASLTPDQARQAIISAKQHAETIIGPQQQIKWVNTGGAMVGVDAATGQLVKGVSPIPVTMAPSTQAQIDAANKRSAASIAATERGQDMAAKTAALKLQGTQPSALSVEETAQMIANGQMPMLTGYSLKTPWGQEVVARVGQLKPDFNAATYGARASTLKAFSSGQQANTVRSLNVAISHLGTLASLTDALNNGDVQLINKAANAWKTQTGSAAPTNFTSARDIVANEVVKAITASGGTLTDRQEAQQQIKAASSPQQLAGVIATWKQLLGGQLGGLRQQYQQGTGRDDFQRFLSPDVRVQLEGQQGVPAAAPATPTAAPAASGWTVTKVQ